MINLLYQIIIQPIYMLLEILYKFFFDAANYNPVYTIILISFMISVFCLPLYLRADAISEEEAQIKKKLHPRVDSIKKNFKGDERQFILQTYYRQNNYHPAMALRSSFSLLLQIPFFLAAYYFFSRQNLGIVNLFGFFFNFNEPDRLLCVGNFEINILPVIMTAVNIEAGIIYAKNKSFKDNLNLYIISFVFLVLLYNQPSGMVFYWLFNNIFSLIKNILLKITTPQTLLKYTFASVLFVLYLGFKSFHLSADVFVAGIILFLIAKFYKGISIENLQINSQLYFGVMLGFWVLTGIFIPAAVISSSPLEFLSDIVHPLQILIYPAVNSFGIFILWGTVLWYLSDEKTKKILSLSFSLLFPLALINYFLVPVPAAHLLNNLTFDTDSVSFFFTTFTQKFVYILLLLAACFTAAFFIVKNKTKILDCILAGIITTGLLFSGYNIIKICNTASNSSVIKNAKKIKLPEKYFHFSKTGKNVLVIFLDNAVNSFFPLILKEKPELNKIYSGFTYYPNTASLYFATVFGYPSVIGGYEYSPLGMAKSDDKFEWDNDKAFSMLPLLFKKRGWDSVVSDSPWAEEKPNFVNTKRIYSDKGIRYLSVRPDLRQYFNSFYRSKSYSYKYTKRNFIFYSLMMVSPSRIRKYFYNRGRYLNTKLIVTELPTEFFENYAELDFLPRITGFDAKNNTFTMINNSITHSTAILKFPEYIITSLVDAEKQDKTMIYNFNKQTLPIYHAFASAIISLGRYFDYLRENGVYDNTRIIIVSDHGSTVAKNPEIKNDFYNNHAIKYHPLLLVKDFNQKGEIKISEEFMCNSDTPYLASKNIIINPKNPHTNKQISTTGKQKGLYVMEFDKEWKPEIYYGRKNPLHSKKHFSLVKNNIFKKENWQTDIPYSEIKIKENLK